MIRELRRERARRAWTERRRRSRRQVLAAAGIAVLLVVVLSTIAGARSLERHGEAARAWASAQASVSAHAAFVGALPLVVWTFEGAGCADGWGSPPIGQRGACSWHGGEVGVWRSAEGVELRCRNGGPPLTREEQYDQRNSSLWRGTYWCV